MRFGLPKQLRLRPGAIIDVKCSSHLSLSECVCVWCVRMQSLIILPQVGGRSYSRSCECQSTEQLNRHESTSRLRVRAEEVLVTMEWDH